LSHPERVHIALVNTFLRNTAVILQEYVVPERLGEALDKLHQLQAAVTPL
jgi:hypothetical protein